MTTTTVKNLKMAFPVVVREVRRGQDESGCQISSELPHEFFGLQVDDQLGTLYELGKCFEKAASANAPGSGHEEADVLTENLLGDVGAVSIPVSVTFFGNNERKVDSISVEISIVELADVCSRKRLVDLLYAAAMYFTKVAVVIYERAQKNATARYTDNPDKRVLH